MSGSAWGCWSVWAGRDRVDGRWVYYSVDRTSAAHWQTWFGMLFDPTQIQTRQVCGPEGQLVMAADIPASR